MNSPGNGYPQRGAAGMFLHAQTSPRFSPHGMYSSHHKYSPGNSPPERYSPNNSSHHKYSPVNSSLGRYSPSNSSDGYSPRNQFQGGYSSRNTSPSSSFGAYSRNASPLHQQALRQSFNKSRDSYSSFSSRSSLDSSDHIQRFKPYDLNKRNKQHRNSWNNNRGYNIEDYILPSMLEDPWAALKTDKKQEE